MAFYPNRKSAEESNISLGSLGAKINKYRELRNMSQKELGIMCGFKDTTADSRIAQYEKMKRTPGNEVLCDIAKALGISRYALYETDVIPVEQMMHILFDIEDFHGLHVKKFGDEYHLVFDKNNEEYEKVIVPFLKSWYEYGEKEKYFDDFLGIEFKGDYSSKDYDIWRASYPGTDKREYQRYIAEQKMNKLQKEMDAINAEVNAKETLGEIEGIETELIFRHMGEEWTLLPNSISEVCDVIGECVKGGLKIELASKRDAVEYGEDTLDLFSLKVADILSSDDMKLYTAKVARTVSNMRPYGIELFKKITSKNKELRLTYYTSASNAEFASVLHDFIKEIQDLWEQKMRGGISEKKTEELEWGIKERLNSSLTSLNLTNSTDE